MDPTLWKGKEDFKKRAIAATEKSKKSREAAAKAKANVQATQKKVKKSIQTFGKAGMPPKAIHSLHRHCMLLLLTENLDTIKSAAQNAHRSNNPHRLLKSIMDMMKERYMNRNYERISLDEIFAAIELTELKADMRLWIQDALASNLKVQFYPEEERYLFKPSLGHDVCNRKQLLAKLRDNEEKGLGGIVLSDIKEAVHNHERAIKASFPQ